nr:protein MICROTUBULE BINDING PROTEIN 2C [Ipomoea batatas]GMD45284.1 protein MICROTUBULE BINDING PROTEIN 2C [Ipomoea batatas]GME12388.1 protein MICROTUBULE BINDING PROTEIN 2C [Ipomoea batatas]
MYAWHHRTTVESPNWKTEAVAPTLPSSFVLYDSEPTSANSLRSSYDEALDGHMLNPESSSSPPLHPWLVTDDIRKIFPLVLSLDQNPNASFTRKASVNYTKTPSRESLYNKAWAKEDLLREQNKELQTYRLKDLCKDMVVGLNNSVDV